MAAGGRQYRGNALDRCGVRDRSALPFDVAVDPEVQLEFPAVVGRNDIAAGPNPRLGGIECRFGIDQLVGTGDVLVRSYPPDPCGRRGRFERSRLSHHRSAAGLRDDRTSCASS